MVPGTVDHVHALLDQRALRADVPPQHTRFSTASDCSDSPSLYSHFDTSYRTNATPALRFPHFNEQDAYHEHHTPYIVSSPAIDPATPRPQDTYSELHSTRLENDPSPEPTDDEDPDLRMSMLGPKMRVHSRAPWEEEGTPELIREGGSDNLSIFGGKKSGLSVIRGLGFGSKSPITRPSFESTKGKRSTETTSTFSTSRSAIYTSTQASVSSSSLSASSLALGRFPSKQSATNLVLGRDRSLSVSSRYHDSNSVISIPPPMPVPRVADYGDQSCDQPLQPYASLPGLHPSSKQSPERTPSPLENDAFVHPYANPALLTSYHRGSIVDPFARYDVGTDVVPTPTNDSMATLSVSDETVTVSQSSSISVCTTSSSGLESSTPPTSSNSLKSFTSEVTSEADTLRMSEAEKTEVDAEARRQTWNRQDIKLGSISTPATATNGVPQNSKSMTLISLEQAQARVKERNRIALEASYFPSHVDGDAASSGGQKDFRLRARTVSAGAAGRAKSATAHIIDGDGAIVTDRLSPTSTSVGKQAAPLSLLPTEKVLKPKRSGFMKLFNGKERDKGRTDSQQQPPLPSPVESHNSSDASGTSCNASASRPSKSSSHRVPVPRYNNPGPSAAMSGRGIDLRPNKPGPSLSIDTNNIRTHVAAQGRQQRSASPAPSYTSLSPHSPTSAPVASSQFPTLQLRPMSGLFSGIAGQFLSNGPYPEASRTMDPPSQFTPMTVGSNDLLPSPYNSRAHAQAAGCFSNSYGAETSVNVDRNGENQSVLVSTLKERIRTSRKAWQRQIWELEGQIRDLKAELDELKSGEVCSLCGKGQTKSERKERDTGVIHRPRAKTGYGARFASGNDC